MVLDAGQVLFRRWIGCWIDFIVLAVLFLGCLPLFVGLAIAMPVLGHATWHLYRKVVI